MGGGRTNPGVDSLDPPGSGSRRPTQFGLSALACCRLASSNASATSSRPWAVSAAQVVVSPSRKAASAALNAFSAACSLARTWAERVPVLSSLLPLPLPLVSGGAWVAFSPSTSASAPCRVVEIPTSPPYDTRTYCRIG